MALKLADRMLTVVVTATLTSAVWIVALSGAERGSPTPASQPSPAVMEPAVSPSEPLRQRWLIPVAGVRADQLSDTFGDDRGGGDRRHEALDIAAPAGTAVLAAAPGQVEKLFRSEDGGNTVYIRSSDGRTMSYYAHLQDYAPDLREGAQVAQGERIGTVGSSGNADPAAPHLHFAIMQTAPGSEWWEPGTPINPYPLLRNSGS